MKSAIIILLFGMLPFIAKADHITGGEMFYTYNGLNNGQVTYTVTLKLFMRCNSGRQFPDPAIISAFDKLTFERITDITVALGTRETISLTNADPCISDPPVVCYEVAYYRVVVSLPQNQNGYILASEVNYRIRGINNINSSQVGATYTCEIPGTVSIATGYANVSAKFTASDLVVVCANSDFSYSFAAKDDDGDQLRYFFCAAYASTTSAINGAPAGNPPYRSVSYNTPAFSSSFPLGEKVKIDPNTGLITGTAPEGGIYVVTVCVEEVRNGALIATQRKDIQINIADCSVAAAKLNEDYMVCGDNRTIGISNLSTSPLIRTYDWVVKNPGGATIFSTQNEHFDYTFPQNGVYTVQLTVNRGQTCMDSTAAKVYVYPGLKPDFSFTGICVTRNTVFTDLSTAQSGSIVGWSWDFGDQSSTADQSTNPSPAYHYLTDGLKTASLIVTTSDGCRDTVSKSLTIIDKPFIALGFPDTLVCVNDAVQLQAFGTGNFSWSPRLNMTGVNTGTPVVRATTTSMYYVDLENDGCVNRDSIRVRVTDRVNLQVMNDTTICAGDTIALRIVSDGFRYTWSPAGQLNNPLAKNPVAITPDNTNYQVTAFIGGCSSSATIKVTAVPYPLAFAGNDTAICYNTPATLHALTDGDTWAWDASPGLSNPSILSPLVSPASSTAYIFRAYDNRGCPKPGVDTVLVTVLPRIVPFAGNDTAVIVGQPLQLNATGGSMYSWFPSTHLSDYSIGNPVALFSAPAENLLYKVEVYNSAGCVDSAFVNVKVYATLPAVFVPTAFTPDSDGKNDVLRPIAVGMQRIDFFQVYNRWGQMLFSTQRNGQGWDGRVNGQLQSNNVYVWVVKAVDFTGKPYLQKGTVTLIR